MMAWQMSVGSTRTGENVKAFFLFIIHSLRIYRFPCHFTCEANTTTWPRGPASWAPLKTEDPLYLPHAKPTCRLPVIAKSVGKLHRRIFRAGHLSRCEAAIVGSAAGATRRRQAMCGRTGPESFPVDGSPMAGGGLVSPQLGRPHQLRWRSR